MSLLVDEKAGEVYDNQNYILIVDDDETLLKFFKIHLNKFFDRVIIAANAAEAETVVKNQAVDLVLSDLKMPNHDGLSLMRRVWKQDPCLPFYFISGALLSDYQIKKIKSHADGFLAKPFEVDELHDFIENGLRCREIYQQIGALIPNKVKLTGFLRKHHSARLVSKNRDLVNQIDQLYQQVRLAEIKKVV